MTFTSSRRHLAGFALVLTAALLATACGGGRRYRPLFGWASVPACHAAIRSRAFSEFGRAKVVFDGAADEKRVDNNRVRVTGTATIERKKKGDLPISYECLTNPKRSRLISAKYSARN